MLVDRIMGVLRLDVATYEEIEADESAITEAAIIVAVVALLNGVGSSIGSGSFIATFLSTVVWAFVGWFIWAGVTFWIGTNIFEGKADMGEMLRVLGYAQVPRVLAVLGFIPCLGWIISLGAGIWALVTGFIAVRQGLDIDNTQALITVIIGWAIVIVGSIIIGVFVGGASLGLGALTG